MEAVMLESIKEKLAEILEAYKIHVGYGLFTRSSRKTFMLNVNNALAQQDDRAVIQHILNFANTMHGANADVGCMGGSKLQGMLWGNEDEIARLGGVYQKLYEYLLTPEGGKLCAGMIFTIKKEQVTLKGVPKLDRDILERLIGYNWGGMHSLSRRNIYSDELKDEPRRVLSPTT
jgi:hypothetical protein